VLSLSDDSFDIFANLKRENYFITNICLFISMILCLFIGIILYSIFKKLYTYILSSIISFILFIILFLINKGGDDDSLLVNPVPVILIYILGPIFIFESVIFFKQLYIVSLGLSLKQYESILIYKDTLKNKQQIKLTEKLNKEQQNVQDNNIEGEYYSTFVDKMTFIQRVKNFCRFLTRKRAQSLMNFVVI
jgi:hypothetical protein